MNKTGEGLPKDRWTTAGMFRGALPFAMVFSSAVIALALLVSEPVHAAGFTCAQPAASNVPGSEKKGALDELDEVVVNGRRATENTMDLRAWLKRLVGQYTYEGYVDLCGKGNAAEQRPVTGHASCIGFNAVPSVQCAISVRWPEVWGESGAPVMGGVSNLSPAVVIYGLESLHRGIRSMQVDSNGIAERAMGLLVGETLTSREPCVGAPVPCQKTTWISAKPDSTEISMLIDFEIAHQHVLRYAFLLHRSSIAPQGEKPGASR